MPVVDYQTCAAGNANLSYAKVNDETMLCAGYGGSSVISGCHGDSGGPFVCRERRLWVLRGAVSWGDHRCKAGSTFSVFTRISTFVDWISATKIKPEHVSGKINRIFIIPSLSIKINLIENVKVLIQQSVTDIKNWTFQIYSCQLQKDPLRIVSDLSITFCNLHKTVNGSPKLRTAFLSNFTMYINSACPPPHRRVLQRWLAALWKVVQGKVLWKTMV